MKSSISTLYTLRGSVCFTLALMTAPFVHATPEIDDIITSLTISPEAIFTKESTAIKVFAAINPKIDELDRPKFAVVETDAQGQVLRPLGPMMDDGIMGDQTAGDHTYTRKIQMSEKKAGPRYFTVVEETTGRKLKTIELKVIGRPSFIQMVKQGWDHLTGKTKTPESSVQ